MAAAMLYISDLDGTLLRSDATLSQNSADMLNECIRNGCNFTVASARSRTSMLPILKGLSLKLPVIAVNGGFITEMDTGRHITINSLVRDTARAVRQLLSREKTGAMVFTSDGEKEKLYFGAQCSEGMRIYLKERQEAGDGRLRKAIGDDEELSQHVISFTVIEREERATQTRDMLRQAFGEALSMNLYANMYYPGWYWLQISDRNATKAHAIRWILDSYGFSADQLTVFGDDVNDLAMFELAGITVAPDNAGDSVKKAAQRVIGPSSADSVARYIKNEFMSTVEIAQ
jgi:Cof subfamily protein (haloacid dehalogenase superfamily)